MPDITITALEILPDGGRLTPTCHRRLAYFTVDIGPIRIRGCTLLTSPEGTQEVWLPRLNDRNGIVQRSVAIRDTAVRDALVEAALRAFKALRPEGTGREPASSTPVSATRDDEHPAAPTRQAIEVTRRRVAT